MDLVSNWGPEMTGILPSVTPDDQQSVTKEVTERGGGAFLPNFQESLFLAWKYTLGTNFVSNVLKKVLSVTRLMRYRPIKIIS